MVLCKSIAQTMMLWFILPKTDLSLLIDLNDNEKESIKRYSQGEALFVCGNRRVRMNVMVTPEELESFGQGGGL